MGEKRSIINVSITQDAKTEIHEVLDGLQKRAMGYSATICKLLLQFKADGYQFKDKVR